ncbi:hypothetical protein BCR43DRAFT_482872 [Syncephalastrum racemosum]|uniref:Uncharacterized protein n=1 Tax=Syncephalastrum racemosum TaxID=13706 RepID=A0A1X2HVQ9_SYNRA|nr:hypothetical protein BCR43DRAFT_482872 [Syncephalastrum racemosum]
MHTSPCSHVFFLGIFYFIFLFNLPYLCMGLQQHAAWFLAELLRLTLCHPGLIPNLFIAVWNAEDSMPNRSQFHTAIARFLCQLLDSGNPLMHWAVGFIRDHRHRIPDDVCTDIFVRCLKVITTGAQDVQSES